MAKSADSQTEEAIRVRIAHHLQAHRERLGWTQAQLAEMVDVTPEYLRSLEGARRSPSLRLLCLLGAALGIDPARLLGRAPQRRRRRNPGRPRKRRR